MDGMQILRLGNMCDAPCGLAAQILALSWRSPPDRVVRSGRAHLLCGIVGRAGVAWLRTRPGRLGTADRACRRICAGQAACEPISDTRPPKFQRSTSLALFLQPN